MSDFSQKSDIRPFVALARTYTLDNLVNMRAGVPATIPVFLPSTLSWYARSANLYS